MIKIQQSKLIEDPEEGKLDIQDQDEEKVLKTITSSNEMWQRCNLWMDNCKQQKENFAYFTVEYRAEIHLDGLKDEYVITKTALERPFKREDDTYGGYWSGQGTLNKNELDQLKNDIINWRKELLAAPYCKENADGHALRDIKAENIRVFIDDKAKEFINRTADWSVNVLTAELKAIKETPLTDEYLKKFERLEFLDKEIHKLEYDIMPQIKGKVDGVFSKSDAQTVLDGEKFDLNAALNLFKRLKAKLAVMEKEYDELRHELYRWGDIK